MDFIFGSLTTLLAIWLVLRYFNMLDSKAKEIKRYKFSQSSVYEMIKPLLPDDFFNPKPKKTQSYIHEQRTNVRVIILDGMAYWIKDNKIYEAYMNEGGIDKDSARVVDTMSMDKVQLDKITFIVDTLREGLDDDSWNSRDK